MIIDKLTEFCDGHTMDYETGTVLLTNQIDLGAAGNDIGNGQPVYWILRFTASATDGGDSATNTFRLVSDDTASIHASTSTVHIQTPAFLKTEMTAGTVCVYTLPRDTRYERYLGVNMITATAGFDAGTVDSFLSYDPAGWKAFADASN